MKIAHLILAHRDLPHIIRLTNVLKEFSDVYIHLDKNTDEKDLFQMFKDDDKVVFIGRRLHSEWGGYQR